MPIIKHKSIDFYVLQEKWQVIFESKCNHSMRGWCDLTNKKIYIYNEGNMLLDCENWMGVLLHELFELAADRQQVVLVRDDNGSKNSSWEDKAYFFMEHRDMDIVMWWINNWLAQILSQIDKNMFNKWLNDGKEASGT